MKAGNRMEQIERIERMERILDEASAVSAALLSALERWRALKPQLAELEAYYTSPLWLGDYDDDCAGKLPEGLKRGVLSEDAVDSLLQLQKEIGEELQA